MDHLFEISETSPHECPTDLYVAKKGNKEVNIRDQKKS